MKIIAKQQFLQLRHVLNQMRWPSLNISYSVWNTMHNKIRTPTHIVSVNIKHTLITTIRERSNNKGEKDG
uniref:Uncharacterized protein n=1 Tax=viral metagenome TaxID=1070528 RepID=A0A6M3JPY1_9ZZZZ